MYAPHTLYVRNIEQAAAWLELDGQLSDGYWENARPFDHWKPWLEATVLVAPEGQAPGRTFYAGRDRYAFDSPELLGVVGLRMLGIVRIARTFGLAVANELEFDVTTDGTLGYPSADRLSQDGDYWSKKAAKLDAIGVDKLAAALADPTYTMADLRRDLRDLKQIVRHQQYPS